MKCSLGISNFLEKISSLSHSIICLYFFALITEEGWLFYLSLLFFGALHSNGYIFPFLLHLSLLLSQIFVRPPQTTICLFAFLFLGDGINNKFCSFLRKEKEKLVKEVTFSVYYRNVTGTKFCYCFHFFFMPEAHGKVEIIYP